VPGPEALYQAIVAIDSSKFKAVNSRDRNFTPGKVGKRQQQIKASIQRYLAPANSLISRSTSQGRSSDRK
jgi:hypothetical protein